MVDFTIFFRGLIDQEIATRPLKLAIESGKLGDFTVDKDSFSVVSPTTVSPTTVSPTTVSPTTVSPTLLISTPAGGLCC